MVGISINIERERAQSNELEVEDRLTKRTENERRLKLNPPRPNPSLPPPPPSSPRSPVNNATAVAWSSAQVTLLLRLVPCPVASRLPRLHLPRPIVFIVARNLICSSISV
ncbi:hypothetical protein HN51_021545, partial [Arachis hypogaea]